MDLATLSLVSLLSIPAQASPEQAAAQELVAIVKGSYKQGRFDAARDELKALFGRVPPSVQDNVLFYLGKTYYYLEDHDAAVKVFGIIHDKFPQGDVVTKNALLARTALDMLKAGAVLPSRIEGRRFQSGTDEAGKPVWSVELKGPDRKPVSRLKFRQAWKYHGLLTRIEPGGPEAKAGTEILAKLSAGKVGLRFVDGKSRSLPGRHPNNWRTSLDEEEATEFSKVLSTLLFDDWATPRLARVLTLANNVIDGKDHFEAAGSFTPAELFKAAGYDPVKDSFETGGKPAAPAPSAPAPAEEGL